MNKLVKVIRDSGTVFFVMQCDTGYWFWQVSENDVKEFFDRNEGIIDNLTPELAEQFINSPVNSDKGCSEGEYDSIDDILKEIGA